MTARLKVCHVCKELAAKGSRVGAQTGYWDESEVLILPPRALFTGELKKRVIGTRRQVFVFHEQPTLPALILSYCLSLLLFRGHGFIYDMHDLAEASRWSSARERRFVRIYAALEWVVARLGIPVITVSRGLQRIFEGRYRRRPRLVYNVGTSKSVEEPAAPERGVIYFGQIKEERVSLADVTTLIEAGLRVDLHGVIPETTDKDWSRRLQSLVETSGGAFHGRYSPGDMDFLSTYRFSLIAFEAQRNNIYFCMPNKLFQSLSHGLICVVSDNMKEMIETFGPTGAVVPLSRFRAGSAQSLEADWAAAGELLSHLASSSRSDYVAAVQAAVRAEKT